MRNRIIIGAALASFCALAFYVQNMGRLDNATLKVYDNKATVSQQKSSQEKKTTEQTSSTENDSFVLNSGKKSNSSLSNDIKNQLNNPAYRIQVSAQDLRSEGTFAYVSNSTQPQKVGATMKLFVALAYEKAINDKKIKTSDTYTVKNTDLKGSDPSLTANMAYSFAYILQLMMSKNNNNAANIVLNKLGKDYVNKTAKEFGATDTKILRDFNNQQVGQTTAKDLTKVMTNLYQGKVLNSSSDNRILGLLSSFPTKGLSEHIGGTIYRIADNRSSVNLVQTSSKTYVMSYVSDQSINASSLGDKINNWFAKN